MRREGAGEGGGDAGDGGEWRREVAALSDVTLFPGTDSWYMGAKVPGKPREQLNYAGGIRSSRSR